jgi:predicted transcriptional regulator
MSKIRLNIEVSQELADLIDNLATTEDTTRTEIVRRSLSVLKAFREQQAVGRTHLGFAADPRKLDAEMLGILDSTASAKKAGLPDPIAKPAIPAPYVGTSVNQTRETEAA